MMKHTRKATNVVTAINVVEPSVENQTNSVNRENQSEEFTVEYGFRPFYYLSRVFGFMPFTIICDVNGRAQESKVKCRDILWLAILISSYLLLGVVIFGSMNISQDSITSEYVLVLSEYILAAFLLVFGIFVIGMDMCVRFKLVDILKKFTMFDTEVS